MVLVVKSVADDLTQCARPLVIIVQENYTKLQLIKLMLLFISKESSQNM